MKKRRGDPVFNLERAYADCHEVALSLVDGMARGRALDLGAGQGRVSRALAVRGFEVTAVDVNGDQFRAVEVPFVKSDLNRTLPFPGKSCDLVVAVEILEHLEAPRRFVREIYRVLRPGGLAVVSTPNIASIPSRLFFLATGFFDLYVPSRKRLKDALSAEADGHISPMPGWLLSHFLREAGFRIEKRKYTMAYIPLVPRGILTFLRGPLLGRVGIYAVRKPEASPSEDGERVFTEAGLAPPGVGHEALELGPEARAVAPVAHVDELVEDDVVREVLRQDGQDGVELDASGHGGAPPERSLVPDAQPPIDEAVLGGQGG